MAVTDGEEFRAWLGAQPKAVCIAIAWRTAMRVLPLSTQLSGSDGEARLALATLRAILTSGVAAVRPAPEIEAAALRAAEDADAASDLVRPDAVADAALATVCAAALAAADRALAAAGATDAAYAAAFPADAAEHAADAAIYAADVVDAAASAAYADTDLPPDAAMSAPISVPAALRALIDPARRPGANALSQTEGPWAFWGRWYEAAMDAQPLDWTLQAQIVRLPNEIWARGPEAVAAEITRLEARHAG